MKSIILCLASLLYIHSVTFPLDASDDYPRCGNVGPKKTELSDSEVTILGLTIGKASLDSVQAKIGRTNPLPRSGKDEEEDIRICYVSPNDGTMLIFSSGAMGGWKDITGFTIASPSAGASLRGKCAKSSLVKRDLSSGLGIKLGMSEREIRTKMMSMPALKKGASVVTYESTCTKPLSAPEIENMKKTFGAEVSNDSSFYVSSWVEVQFKDRKTSRITITKIESF